MPLNWITFVLPKCKVEKSEALQPVSYTHLGENRKKKRAALREAAKTDPQ